MNKDMRDRVSHYLAGTRKATLFDFLTTDLHNIAQEHIQYDDTTHGDIISIYKEVAKACRRKYVLGGSKTKILREIRTKFASMKETTAGKKSDEGDSAHSDTIIIADQVSIGDHCNLSKTVFKRKFSDRDDERPSDGEDEPQDVHVRCKKGAFTVPAAQLAGLTPNKPKIHLSHLHDLNRNAHIATSFAMSFPETTNLLPERLRGAYNEQKEAGRNREALKKYPSVQKHLRLMLRQLDDWNNWDGLAYQFNPMSLDSEEGHFWRTLRYGLIAMHGAIAPLATLDAHNHERTATVDLVVPWLGPLRLLGDVSWRWCEFGMKAKKRDMSASGDASRFADGLALVNGAEIIFLESSGGLLEECVEHTMDDSVKLIEAATYALKEHIRKNKDASFDTVKKRAVFTLHVIRNTLTLGCVGLAPDGARWEVIELRSAELPTCWENAGAALGVAELLATLYQHIKAQKTVQKVISLETNGLNTPIPLHQTVRQRLTWLWT
ncbi:hypothetical protein DFS34DRAFT_517783 [Phlyctochytrium arcticum]|nr:hypothetical protein DFS34DRAFT_517783 [Phlyctochytrium arcticum]